MRTPLVRGGVDFIYPPDRETGAERHTMHAVYREMLLQICRYYSGLPDVRTLTNREIRFFYNALREELRRATAPKKR